MKNSKRILSFLFFALMGSSFSLAIGIMPIFGALLGFVSYLPITFPAGILGDAAIGQTELDAENKILAKMEDRIKKSLAEYNRDGINEDGLKLRLIPIEKQLSELKENGVNKADIAKFAESFDKLSAEIASIKEQNSIRKFDTKESAIEDGVKQLLASEKYDNWVKNGCKGEEPQIQLKYSIASGNTGTVLISTQSPVVSDPLAIRTLHVRDLVPTMQTSEPYLVHDTVTSFSNPAYGLAENDAAVESTFTTAEVTTGTNRIALFMDFSKRALKAKQWIQGHILSRLPERIKFHEDFQLLFGDGAGNNVNGLFKNATLLNVSGPSFVATAFLSVATYSSGAKSLVTFLAAHGLINGQILTIANATNAGYNVAHTVNVLNDTQILLDVAYVAEAANLVDDWTATSKYGVTLGIDLANNIDVLRVSAAVNRLREYQITAHVINPMDAALIESIKSTTGEYALNPAQRINGILYVGGIPCIETPAMKTGWFMSADFRNVAELLEFTQLTLRFATDTTYEKANKVMLIAEEEIVFPIYNKFLATYGNFATVKTALETA